MYGRAGRTTSREYDGRLNWKAPAHCAKCGAWLERAEMFVDVPRNLHGVQDGDATLYARGVHKCPRMWLTRRLLRPSIRLRKHLRVDRFALIPQLPAVTKRQRTRAFPTHFNGIPRLKVQRLADTTITKRALKPIEQKAVEAYLQIVLANMGYSENAGAPERPVVSVESRETTIFFIDPATGERTGSVTKIIEDKTRLATVGLDAFIEEIASDEELSEW